MKNIMYKEKEIPTMERAWAILDTLTDEHFIKNTFYTKGRQAIDVLLENQETAYEGAYMLAAFSAWVNSCKVSHGAIDMNCMKKLGVLSLTLKTINESKAVN